MSTTRTDNADKHLTELESIVCRRRVVIVGVGRHDRGDDGFGPAVIKAVAAYCLPVPLIDAGPCPENVTEVIARHEPTGLLWLDAGAIGQPPGAWLLCGPDALAGTGTCTHTGSLALVARYLEARTGALSWFLLAQPANVGEPGNEAETTAGPPQGRGEHHRPVRLSAPVAEAVRQVSQLIADTWSRCRGARPHEFR